MINLKKTNLPPSPGVYKFLNKDSGIIYVGKSKNLKKRVTSYFRKNVENKKIKRMVKEVSKIEFVLSESEHDALLLENNLIKEDKPKYNILLRDDKTYPWICIKNERFPKLIPVLDGDCFRLGTAIIMVYLHFLYKNSKFFLINFH